MSFSFTAIGTRDQVIAQCRAHNIGHGRSLAIAARDLITEALEGDDATPGREGWAYAYVVTANGHNGAGAPVSLNIKIEAQWVPHVVEAAVTEASEEAAGELAAAFG
jgi:hypothetical protein